MPNLREQVLELVRNCNLTHKPDRYPAGKFFQETAYRRVGMDNGGTRLVVRTALSELVDNKTSLDKARKAIGDIVSDEVKHLVSSEFEKRIASGVSPQAALSAPIAYPRYGNGEKGCQVMIKKVHVYQRMGRGYADGDDVVPIIHARRDGTELLKNYLSDGYAYVALTLDSGKLVTAESVPLHCASRRLVNSEYNETRYYANDTLRDASTGRRYLVRQIRANAALALTLISEAREVRDMDANAGLMLVSGRQLLRLARA
jgi:CRISPR-associated endonuclease Csn1